MGYFNQNNEWNTITESTRKSSEVQASFPVLDSPAQSSQIGAFIEGEAGGDVFGSSVSFNKDGTIVAIGKMMEMGQVQVMLEFFN